MIRTETITIDGVEYTHTWSDSGFRIMQESGAVYDEAMDVTAHTYTETDEPIQDEITDSEALNILLGRGVDEIQ